MYRYLNMLAGLYAALLLLCLSQAPPACGEILTMDEDFSRTLNRDSLMTSADWDTTAQCVHLHSRTLSTLGIYDGNAAYASAALGPNLFLADGSGGLRSLDLSDPANPTALDQVPCADQAKSLVLGPAHAFVGIGNGGVQVVHIADPENLVDLGAFDPGGQLRYVNGVALAGDILYLAEADSGVTVVDVANPVAPVLLRRVDTGIWARDVHVHAGYLYVADDGLKIFNLADPANPALVGSAPVTGTALRITVSGGRAFVACGSSGLQVFDVTDPADPQLLNTLTDWNSCQQAGATAGGDTVFVAAGTEGMVILDMSDPIEPVEIGSRDTNQAAVHVAHRQGLIMVSAVLDGVLILELDPDGWDPDRNRAQSINLNPLGDPVTRVSLTAAANDSVAYSVSGDGGSSWHAISADGSWLDFAEPATDIRWRALLHLSDDSPAEGPRLYGLELILDVQSSLPDIGAVEDVPDDEGRQVRVRWYATRHDSPEGEHTITQYSLYHRFSGAATEAPPDIPYPPGQWDFVTSIPADMEAEYAAVVPTLADSSAAGIPWAVFFVRARTDQPGLFFDSAPDSGYSVDNLQPPPPTGLVIDFDAPGGTFLQWDPAEIPDFAHFRIYRSESPDLPQPATLHAVTADSSYLDEVSWRYYYHLTVVDLAGHESDPTGLLSPVFQAGAALRLEPNHPNPFNPRTVIAFHVTGTGSMTRLEIYDLRGRRVRTLMEDALPAGRHEAVWDGLDGGGRACASGPYQVLLRQGDATERRKVMLIR